MPDVYKRVQKIGTEIKPFEVVSVMRTDIDAMVRARDILLAAMKKISDPSMYVTNSGQSAMIASMAIEEYQREMKGRRFDMRKTYTVEIKVDFDDEERHELMIPVLRKAARNLLTNASLLADNHRQPQVAVRSEDFFAGPEEISAMELPKEDE